MTIAASPQKRSPSRKTKRADLLPQRELRGIIETVLQLAKSTDAEETEVHVDEVADALTRFANNGIHQNVFEHGVTVSVRTVSDGRTARATTNRLEEDSLRAAIEASLSLAHSQPKDPRLLPMPGKQRYRQVNRFIKATAALTPEDRARAVRRACDLATKKGQVAAGIFSSVVVRTNGDPSAANDALRRAIWAIDRDQPVGPAQTAEAMLDSELWLDRGVVALLFGIFAALALLLAAAGLYSVGAYLVSQRKHEFGLRIALGAQRKQIVWLVLTYATTTIGTGLALGLALSAALNDALARWARASVRDPYVFACLALLLFAVGTLAALIPACRAGSIDPISALRAE